LFGRADLDAYLGRPMSSADAGGRDRVEALYCRVSGVYRAGVVAGES
jgi:hypothetical protein